MTKKICDKCGAEEVCPLQGPNSLIHSYQIVAGVDQLISLMKADLCTVCLDNLRGFGFRELMLTK